MVESSFLFLFFARFPLEGTTFRDLCSPMGLSRLSKGRKSAFELWGIGHPKSEARHIDLDIFHGNFWNCREKVKLIKHPAHVAIWTSLPAEHVQDLRLVVGGFDLPGELVKP